MRHLLIALALICLAVSPLQAASPDATEGAKVAKAANAAAIPTINGPDLLELLRQQKGRPVLVNFFASWCPPCREELPELLRLRSSLPEDRLVLIGVSVDENPEALAELAARTGFSYPVYRATPDASLLFGVSSIPHNLIYDAAGRLLINEPGIVDAETVTQFLQTLEGAGGEKRP